MHILTLMATPKLSFTEADLDRSVPVDRGGDFYDQAYIEYTTGNAGRLASSVLNEKKFTIKDTDQTYRLINHWSHLGLIADDRKKEGEWRKLSILDLVWIHVLVALRGFGLPHNALQMTQKTLFKRGSKTELCPFFEFAIAQVLMKQEQYLIVFSDGKAAALEGGRLAWNCREFKIGDHICINLNRLASGIFEGKDFTPVYHSDLDNNEVAVLLHMRDRDCESVSVKTKDGKIELIEATQTVEAQKRIVDLLKEHAYQDITVKRRGGKIVLIKRTVQTKPASKATGKTRASSSTEPLRSSDKPKSNAVHSNAHG